MTLSISNPNKRYYNLDFINRLIKNKQPYLKLLIISFVESTPQILSSLQEAYEMKNFAKIQREAHKIRASYANFRIDDLKIPLQILDEEISQLSEESIERNVKLVLNISNRVIEDLKMEASLMVESEN